MLLLLKVIEVVHVGNVFIGLHNNCCCYHFLSLGGAAVTVRARGDSVNKNNLRHRSYRMTALCNGVGQNDTVDVMKLVNCRLLFHYNRPNNRLVFSKGSINFTVGALTKAACEESWPDKHQKRMACTQLTHKQQTGED